MLLQAVGACEDGAFTRLYGMTSARVAAYLCRVLRNQEAVHDILVQTYVEVWRNARKFNGGSTAIAWIVGIARSLAMNQLGQQASSEDDSRRRVLRALAALPQHHREILALALMREFSYEEIAMLLAIPVNTAKTRVFHAKAALREELQTMGIARQDAL